jgi:hypothetical protein
LSINVSPVFFTKAYVSNYNYDACAVVICALRVY